MDAGASGNGWCGWRRPSVCLVLIGCFPLLLCGCTSFSEWAHNGFKVGPNYHPLEAPVPPTWIDANDPRVRPGNPNIATWWEVFDDAELNRMIHVAATENLTVRQAGLQILQAQIQRNIARSELLPQAQTLLAQSSRGELSGNNGFSPIPGASIRDGVVSVRDGWFTGNSDCPYRRPGSAADPSRDNRHLYESVDQKRRRAPAIPSAQPSDRTDSSMTSAPP